MKRETAEPTRRNHDLSSSRATARSRTAQRACLAAVAAAVLLAGSGPAVAGKVQLYCRGGGNSQLVIDAELYKNFRGIIKKYAWIWVGGRYSYQASKQRYSPQMAPGTCAFLDRGMRKGEPLTLIFNSSIKQSGNKLVVKLVRGKAKDVYGWRTNKKKRSVHPAFQALPALLDPGSVVIFKIDKKVQPGVWSTEVDQVVALQARQRG